MQRLQDRHRGHRRAVRVGDDALRTSATASGFTSLTMSRTSGSIRHADELSMTVAPAAAKPGRERGMCFRRRRTGRCPDRWGPPWLRPHDDVLPRPRQGGANRTRRAKNRIWVIGKSRSARIRRMTSPTRPVAPTTRRACGSGYRPRWAARVPREPARTTVAPWHGTGNFRDRMAPSGRGAGRRPAVPQPVRRRDVAGESARVALSRRRRCGAARGRPGRLRTDVAGPRLTVRVRQQTTGDPRDRVVPGAPAGMTLDQFLAARGPDDEHCQRQPVRPDSSSAT